MPCRSALLPRMGSSPSHGGKALRQPAWPEKNDGYPKKRLARRERGIAGIRRVTRQIRRRIPPGHFLETRIRPHFDLASSQFFICV